MLHCFSGHALRSCSSYRFLQVNLSTYDRSLPEWIDYWTSCFTSWSILFSHFQNTSMAISKDTIYWTIGTSYPRIATNFQSLYLAEIFALLLWNLLWWLLLPSFRLSQIFIIFRRVVLEICDSSFLEFSKIRSPYREHLTNLQWFTKKIWNIRAHNSQINCIIFSLIYFLRNMINFLDLDFMSPTQGLKSKVNHVIL